MKRTIQCPKCYHEIEVFKNPIPTVDIIIEIERNTRCIPRSLERGQGELNKSTNSLPRRIPAACCGVLQSKEIVLIKRKNPPYGWAIPGGFVDYGESLKEAAIREAKEETNLEVKLIKQFHTYSDPNRDPRHHSISTVYIAKAKGIPQAKDDAVEIGIFNESTLPEEIAFDHRSILEDYLKFRKEEEKEDLRP